MEAFPTEDRKATTVAKILVNEIICRHGAPRELLSDQGKEFLSNVMKEVCEYFVTKKINTTSYHPQTNGLTERFNGSLCQILSAYCNTNQTNWDVYLPIALFAYRTSVQKTVNESPFRLLYGRNPRLPSDLDRWSPNSSFVGKLDEAWKQAKSLVETQAAKSTQRLLDKYNTTPVYKIGDWVRLHNPVTKIGLKKKLRGDLWKGPFKILDITPFNVKLDEGKRQVWQHKNRIKRAEKPRQSRYGRVYKKVNRLGIH